MQNNSKQWLTTYADLQKSPSGTFHLSDDDDGLCVLHWRFLKAKDPKFNQSITQAREVLVQTYTSLELDFAQKHPQAVKNEYFIRSLAPLIEGVDKVDWGEVQDKIKDIFTDFYLTTDFSRFANPEEPFIHVLAIDASTDKVIGFVQFSLPLNAEHESIKVGYFGVRYDQSRLDQILMSSLYKILPMTKRLYLHTRSSNTRLIERLTSWGFQSYAENMPGWPDYEYLSDRQKILQEVAHLRLF